MGHPSSRLKIFIDCWAIVTDCLGTANSGLSGPPVARQVCSNSGSVCGYGWSSRSTSCLHLLDSDSSTKEHTNDFGHTIDVLGQERLAGVLLLPEYQVGTHDRFCYGPSRAGPDLGMPIGQTALQI